jgi:Family of unknown function (DUF5681)
MSNDDELKDENMSNDDELEDDKVGYGKPPKSGQFKKGISGNPSGRPKKPTDSVSVLMRELDSKLTINENGQRKVITKLEGIWKRSVNKAVTGDPKSIRLVVDHLPRADESAAELQQNSPDKPDYAHRKAADFTDDELALISQGIHPKYSDNQKPDNQLGSKKKATRPRKPTSMK